MFPESWGSTECLTLSCLGRDNKPYKISLITRRNKEQPLKGMFLGARYVVEDLATETHADVIFTAVTGCSKERGLSVPPNKT